MAIPGSICTTHRLTRRGSTKSNDGSVCSPTSNCGAAHTAQSKPWRKTSVTGSTTGTKTQSHSPGPRPPTKSWNASPHIYIEFPAQDTSRTLHRLWPERYPEADSWAKQVVQQQITANWFVDRAGVLLDRRGGGRTRLVYVVDNIGAYVAQST